MTQNNLINLGECQRLSHERASQIPLNQQFVPTDEIWDVVVNAYKATGTADKVDVVGRVTLVITTPKENFLTISAQEIPRCWAVLPYVNGIAAYAEKVDELARSLGFKGRSSGRAKGDIFKKLPAPDWETALEPNDVSDIKRVIKNEMGLNPTEQENFLRFLADGIWSGVSKTLERGDWMNSAIISAGGWLVNAADRRGELSIALATSSKFERLMASASTQHQRQARPTVKTTATRLKGGENVIFYGAPGTGKSNRVEKLVRDAEKKPIRTVFHPDLQNSDFFGCLKPRMKGKNVRYEFAPGPFMEALSEAYETPGEPVFLVIEELNRAAAAAVFGDLFLLLDRDDDGVGEYTVSFPSPESRVWFEGETKIVHERIKLPSNLYIYATMNSADQGVYPIDTAFRRRWRQEYLPLDYTAGPDGEIAYIDVSGKRYTLEWREFIEVLNDYLVSNKTLAIAEDRLLGQWFVKKKELDGAGIPEKVLLYLWDDLLRHDGRDQIFDTGNISTYGALDKAVKDGDRFLSDGFLGVLNTVSNPELEPENADKNGAG